MRGREGKGAQAANHQEAVIQQLGGRLAIKCNACRKSAERFRHTRHSRLRILRVIQYIDQVILGIELPPWRHKCHRAVGSERNRIARAPVGERRGCSFGVFERESLILHLFKTECRELYEASIDSVNSLIIEPVAAPELFLTYLEYVASLGASCARAASVASLGLFTAPCF